MTNKSYAESDPRHHAGNIKRMLNDVAIHVRDDIQKVQDPQAEALFETTVEVLEGLMKAYTHFENKSEQAWQK